MAKAQKQEGTWQIQGGVGQLYIQCMEKYIIQLFWVFNASIPESCAWNTEQRIQTTPTKIGK